MKEDSIIEVKFRAWDDHENRWIFFSLEELVSGVARDLMLKNWGEFTGQHDKNGVEIYEGDILRYAKFHDKGFVKIVKPNRSSNQYGLSSRPLSTYKVLRSPGSYKVVGNIYQNPELIKKATNK